MVGRRICVLLHATCGMVNVDRYGQSQDSDMG